MKKEDFFELMFREIKQGNMAFFAGAGVSFSSGIPTVPMILEKLMQVLEATDEEKAALFDSALPFELFMECVFFFSDSGRLYGLFKNKKPNRNHYLMSSVCSKYAGGGCIITTNFDTLIEDSFSDTDLFETKTSYTNNDSLNKSIIYKIHGCISDTEALGITLKAVASTTSLQNKKQILEELFINGSHEYVLVWGYSCSDVFDISPLIEKLPVKKTIILIQHEFDNTTFNCRQIGEENIKNPFKHCTGFKVAINTDYLVSEIERRLELHLPGNPDFINNWDSEIEQWGKQPVLSKGQKQTIIGSLMKLTGNYHLSVNALDKAASSFKIDNNIPGYYNCLQNLGQSYLYLNDLENARKCLEASLQFFDTPVYAKQFSSTLNDIGGIYKAMKEFETALQYFQRALEIAVQYQINEHIGNRLGNIAGIYFETGELERSRDITLKALKTARIDGDKQLESNMLSLLAYINESEDQKQSASENSMEAATIASHIGNEKLALYRVLQRAEHLARSENYHEAIQLLNSVYLDKISIDEKIMVLSKIAHQYGNLKESGLMRDALNKLLEYVEGYEISDESKGLIAGNQAKLAYISNDFNEAIRLHAIEYSLLAEKGSEYEMICLLNLSHCYQKLANKTKRKEMLEAAEYIAIKRGNLTFLKDIYRYLGDYYNEITDDEVALDYFVKSLKIHNQIRDENIDNILNCIAKTMCNLNRFDQAIKYWQIALEIATAKRHNALATELISHLQAFKN